LHGARQAEQDPQPRPEDGGHPEEGRPGPGARRARPAAHLRDAAQPGRGGAPDGPGRDAAQQDRPDENVYTDPRVLDGHGALDALPALPLPAPKSPEAEGERLGATGTDGRKFAPKFAPTQCKPGQAGTNPDRPEQ